ncbi:Zn-ribbon domain-containing OB-fold protein [Polymorphobacter sp.]|uniref:Zn-ribbon domain-containing OB-fold protein n=1 Tax=Polymorphobacter sp. TaxID=1909290 RepID=UPI003F728884
MIGPEAEWRAALADGRLLLQRGVESGQAFFPPRLAEPRTGAAVEWIETCGRGTVYSVTVIGRKPPEPAYAVVLVTLAEGPRMMSRVDGVAAEAVTIGMAVRARIIEEEGQKLLVFEPE